VLRGRMADGEYALRHVPGADDARFEAGAATVIMDWASHEVLSVGRPTPQSLIPISVDLSPAMTLRLLLDAVLKAPRVHFVNAPFVE